MNGPVDRAPAAGALRCWEGAGALAQIGRAERCRVTPLGGAPAWARWWRRRLTPGAGVSHYVGSPLHLTRRAADVERRPVDRLTLLVHASAGAVVWQAGRLRRLDAGELVLVDAGAPYDLRAPGGASSALHVARTALPVPAAALGHAAPRLATSPLHDLVRDHVRLLGSLVAAVAPGEALDPGDRRTVDELVAATVGLLGALVLGVPEPW